MTDRPEDRRVVTALARMARRPLALTVAVLLLVAAVAGPPAMGSAARSGAGATPGMTPGTTGTPRAPVEIRSSSGLRVVSVDGTPRATATLPAAPRPGTPVPPAPVYTGAGGGATVPESASGSELRLDRLTVAPRATFNLPESTGWTIVGFSGTVDFFPTTGGVRGDDSFALTAGTQTSGPPAGTFQNLSDGPAVVWLIGVAPVGAPDPATPAGVTLERSGTVTVPVPTAGPRLAIRYRFAAAGPVAAPLDPAGASPGIPGGEAPGSVPAGIVYGVRGSVAIQDAAGGAPVMVGAGQSVSLDDLTGRAISGPGQRATDEPNEYIAVSVREQASQPVPNEPPGAALVPATPGVSPASATPARATPVLVGSGAAGDVVTCDAEPRTVAELQAAIDRLAASPTLISDPFGRSARPLAGTGTPADDATIASLQATMGEFALCGATGDLARAFGLLSDELLAFYLGISVSDLAQLPALATPLPVSSGVPPELVLSGAEVFPDGRAGALVAAASGTTYVTFVPAGDGGWLIDVIDLRAGQGPALIVPAATPAG